MQTKILGGGGNMSFSPARVSQRDDTRSAQQLAEGEAWCREIFAAMTEGIVVMEPITDEYGSPVDYRYLDINPAAERLSGFSREQVGGHYILSTTEYRPSI